MELLKDRLSHILRSKNLTATQFAEMMHIQPSNVSHLLSGRNNPSLDFLIKLKEVFPEYSFDWIIMGKRPITVNEPSPGNNLPSTPSNAPDISVSVPDDQPDLFDADLQKTDNQNENKNLDNKYVKFENPVSEPVKMIFVYDDNSFEVFNLRKND